MRKFWFFDLDGTLADTDRDIREAWKAALRDLGLDCPRFDEVFVAGPPIDEMTRRLFPDRFTPALAERLTPPDPHAARIGPPRTDSHLSGIDLLVILCLIHVPHSRLAPESLKSVGHAIGVLCKEMWQTRM